jgi:peptidoglycan-associated lipoprotein
MRSRFSFFSFLPTLFAAAVLALSLGACKKPEYPACKKDKHCNVERGETCVDKQCQNCKTDEECKGIGDNGADWVCHEFLCQDPAAIADSGGGGGTGEQGSPCTDSGQCLGGLSCKAGICDFCSDDADCLTGGCNFDTGRCSPEGQCTTDDECAMDEICDGGMCIFSGDYGGEEGGGPCNLDAIFFAFDSDKITPQMEAKVKEAASCIAEQSRLLYLEAHADNIGTEEYNILLTERRGQSVKNILVTLGVAAENLQVIAKGSLEAAGQDESSRSQDRRVQFIWP